MATPQIGADTDFVCRGEENQTYGETKHLIFKTPCEKLKSDNFFRFVWCFEYCLPQRVSCLVLFIFRTSWIVIQKFFEALKYESLIFTSLYWYMLCVLWPTLYWCSCSRCAVWKETRPKCATSSSRSFCWSQTSSRSEWWSLWRRIHRNTGYKTTGMPSIWLFIR